MLWGQKVLELRLSWIEKTRTLTFCSGRSHEPQLKFLELRSLSSNYESSAPVEPVSMTALWSYLTRAFGWNLIRSILSLYPSRRALRPRRRSCSLYVLDAQFWDESCITALVRLFTDGFDYTVLSALLQLSNKYNSFQIIHAKNEKFDELTELVMDFRFAPLRMKCQCLEVLAQN